MTTSQSPMHVLKAQADQIAKTLKAAERGDTIDVRFAAKIQEARLKSSLTVGVVMDDKMLKLELPWTVIRESTEAVLSEWILDYMRDVRGPAN